MGRKSVAVLDIRSSKLTLVVGERSVNHTFVFKALKTEEYSGYNGGAFYDEGELAEIISLALQDVEKVCGEKIRRLYVGVPGEFLDVVLAEPVTGFPKRKKITERDIEALYESGKEEIPEMSFLRASCAIFTTADKRMVVDPVGIMSTSLKGLVSYFYCSNYFLSVIGKIFSGRGIELVYLPSTLAMACYLIPSETRDEYSFLLDVGDFSTTVMLVQGNAILKQSTSPVGRAQILAQLIETFSIPYDAAMALLPKTNLYTRSNAGKMEFMSRNVPYEVDSDGLVAAVKDGLDSVCEAVGAFMENMQGRELDYKPLYVTGEGICDIRGALEHVSKRVDRVCEFIAPDLPYYDKPSMSSMISLVDMACTVNSQGGFFNHLFGG